LELIITESDQSFIGYRINNNNLQKGKNNKPNNNENNNENLLNFKI